MEIGPSDDRSLMLRIAQLRPGEVLRFEPTMGEGPPFVVVTAADFDRLVAAAMARFEGEAAEEADRYGG